MRDFRVRSSLPVARPTADLSQPCAPPVGLSLATRSPGVGSQPCGAKYPRFCAIPRAPKLLICGLFQKGRVLAQDGVNRQQQDVIDYLQEENRVLRAGLRGKRLRLSDDDRRRLAVKAQALGREALAQIASVATPATLLRWYRCLIAANYDGSKNRSPGRPPTAKDIRELIVRVAQENPTWGYTRLRGALKNLGHELGRNTIKRLLAEHGIAPAPERGRSMSWSTFIKAHWGAIAATEVLPPSSVATPYLNANVSWPACVGERHE